MREKWTGIESESTRVRAGAICIDRNGEGKRERT